MGLQSSCWLLLAVASLPAVAAEPPAKPAAAASPGEELLEYLGTWNGDEEWLHSEDLLPPPSRPDRSGSETDRQREKRAPARDASEQ